ncbi:hypothetical protein F4782DRAFT_528746 [Xylaria castorea]|nr:hypothetical protein F4782DRAFT_528746 [Xylaria castorea]
MEVDVEADANPVTTVIRAQRVGSIAPAFVAVAATVAALSVTVAAAADDLRLPKCEFIVSAGAHSVTPQPTSPLLRVAESLGSGETLRLLRVSSSTYYIAQTLRVVDTSATRTRIAPSAD